MQRDDKENSWSVRFALVLTIVLWGSAFVGIRAALKGGYAPGSLALLRYFVASIVIIPFYLKLPHRVKIRASDWPLLFGLGLFGFSIYNLCLNMGELSVSAGVAAFMVGVAPVISTVIAIVFLKERVKKMMFWGIGVSLVGVIIVALSKHQGHTSVGGVLLLLASAFSVSFYSTMQKPLLKRIHGFQFFCLAMWLGVIPLLYFTPNALHDLFHTPFSSTLWVVYLGVFPGAIAYASWSYVLTYMPTSKTVVAMYGMPVAAILLGWILLGEWPTLSALLGSLLALFGAYLVRRQKA